MACLRAARLAAFASLALVVPASVSATSCLQPLYLILGFLGAELDHGQYGFVDDQVGALPRNAAIFTDRRVGTPPVFGFGRPLVELEVEGLWRLEPPLPPETRISYREQTAVTTAEIDTQPPTGIDLVSVERFGCGFRFLIDGTSSDDQAPADRLTYVLYGGANPEEAATTTMPLALVPALNVWHGDDSDYLYLGRADPPWFTVSVVDLAGNQSSRSEAVPLTHIKGCDAAPFPDAGSKLLAMLGLVALVMLRARGRRA